MLLRALLGAFAVAIPCLAPAQSGPTDAIWYAENSRPLMMDRFGVVHGQFGPFADQLARSITGEIWAANGAVVTVLAADGRTLASFTMPADVRDLAVDAAGHAWIGMVDGRVEERDPVGTLGASFLLPGAARSLAVDETGRLWCAVDNQPGALLSWRDPGSATLSTVALPRVIGLVADLAVDGRVGGSHVWVVGVDSNEVVELDRQGFTPRSLLVGGDPAPGLRQVVVGPDGLLWVAAETGLWSVDPTTGASDLCVPRSTSNLSFDVKGDLWATVSHQLVRIDVDARSVDFVLTGTAYPILDEAGGLDLARIVDQGGDADGDGFGNRAETDAGTNPFDALSSPRLDLATSRLQTVAGDDVRIVARGDLGWGFVVFGTRSTAPPVTIPGVDGALLLGAVFPVTLAMPVPGSLSLTVPADATRRDMAWIQMLRTPVGAAPPRISELVGFRWSLVSSRGTVENFTSVANLDIERSAGSWGGGLARPGALGGIGRLGSFDPTLGTQVAPDVYEFDTDGHVFPASATLFGGTETVSNGVFEFTDFVVPAGTTVRFVGSKPAVVRVRGNARIDGVVEVNGQDVDGGFDATAYLDPFTALWTSRDGQAGSSGGAGGAAGGRGGDGCPGGGTGGGLFDGAPGGDLIAPLLSGYAGREAATGGRGSGLFPADGLRASVTFNLFFSLSGMVTPGGGGGGYLSAGAPGRALRSFTGVAADLGPDALGGVSVPFLPAPGGVSALDHYLVGGSGGGGGGSHPLNMTTNEINGGPPSGPKAWHAGAGGAGGGGALGLRVGRDLVVGAQGGLQSRGGSGSEYLQRNLGPPAPGGGGGGGSVVLQVGAAVQQGGAIDLSGGSGGLLRHVQFTGQFVEAEGGDGAPGYVRLEAHGPVVPAWLGNVVGPASVGADNVGVLTERDAWTGQMSKWYATQASTPPRWSHYELRALVNQVDVTYSDDPTNYSPAAGPGVPVQLWVQGALVDANGEPVGSAGPWRPFVADLAMDRANGFRFMLLYDRSVAADVAVDRLVVRYEL